ncbi:MAG: ammonium transporter [Aestuariibacter sp.]|nr:ammonium transporter [Aestuariibacter sp.]
MGHTQFDILWISVSTALILFMQAGFLCLETGLTRSKNNINVALKNLCDFGVSFAVFWAFGYAFLFGTSAGGWIGTTNFLPTLAGTESWPIAFFAFQAMFCSTAATIVSGAVAERMRFGGYIVATILVAGLFYPIFGHWAWNGTTEGNFSGWLRALGFIDFAGSTVVHSLGGWFALAAVLIIGPRTGRFSRDGATKTIPGANLPMATLGVMLMWFGWLGFNGGSLFQFNDQAPGVIANTIIAGIAGLITVLLSEIFLRKSVKPLMLMNGPLAGLVAITAGCHAVDARSAFMIGAGGAIAMWGTTALLERLRIDDAVGAIGVHLGAGIWGTLAVALFAEQSWLLAGVSREQQFLIQLLGITVCFLWTFPLTLLLLWGMNRVTPLRVTLEAELIGLNVSEHGATSAYQETFDVMNQQALTGDLSLRAPLEPFTEVGEFARHYNRVIDHLQGTLVHNERLKVTKIKLEKAAEQLRDQKKGLNEEISVRKRAEQELRNLRNYLSSIIDSMPSVIIGVDTKSTVTLWNYEAQRITGIKTEDAVGQSLDKVFPHLSAKMDRVREAVHMRKICSEPRQIRKKNGDTYHEDITIYPLIAKGVEGAVIRVDDVTDQVRIDEMLVQSEKMASVGGLAAGMAHEINNPLAGMMQTASVLLHRLSSDMPRNDSAAKEAGTSMSAIRSFMEAREVPNMLRRMSESGRRASEIVANMLSFARKSEDSFTYCDLTKLLNQCVELASSDYNLKKKYDFRQIEIIREYDENLPKVYCEAGEIQQVMLNILRNGAEAMHLAALEIKDAKPLFILRLIHEQKENMVRIEIEDSGPGIDEATRKRIFEPFFTTKPPGLGTGLGLSVSYFIVTENHAGEMAVESPRGTGTLFVIRLPVLKGS